MKNETLYAERFETGIGEVLLIVDERGALRQLSFLEPSSADEVEARLRERELSRGSHLAHDSARTQPARKQLEELLAGKRKNLDLSLEPNGTPFQLRVWEALRRIPRGETRTYGQLAAEIGSPAAVRAVGRANATNPIAVAIPCHRVIGADGTLTGYFGGIQVKRALLDLESGVSLFP